MGFLALASHLLLVQSISNHYSTVALAEKSKVILVSMDGFRYDYLYKANTPNFDKMITEGVTMPYMQNTFITNTFPSHYTMATGLYSEVHGIVASRMYDPVFDSYFTAANKDPRWWDGGEPVWITATKAGLKAGTYFWPGSAVMLQGLRPERWYPYNESVPYEARVQTTIEWMSRYDFDLAVIYFNEPNTSGHKFGPDDPRLVPVIEYMDDILGLLIDGLDKANLTDQVNLIVASDHGMASVDYQNKIIDISDYVNASLLLEMVTQGPAAHLRPQPGKAIELVSALSGIDHLHVMLKEDIPEHFHLKDHRRVMPVFVTVDEGWTVTDNATQRRQLNYGGDHGYDNFNRNMNPIFVAKGPAFKSGEIVGPIISVDIYSLVCHLLDIQPAPNNGSMDRVRTLLN